MIAQTVYAHVRYLASDNEVALHGGADASFLLGAFSDPTNLMLMFLTVVIAGFLFVLVRYVPILGKELTHINTHADSYHDLITWMLRLSVGISLLGSGVAGNLVSPVVEASPQLATLQILLGFLILAGLLLAPALVVTILLYLLAVSTDIYVLGNLEFLMAAAAALILADRHPGVDDLLGIPSMLAFKKLRKWVPLLLRVGIGGAMIYLAVYEKFLNPHISELIVHEFALQGVIPVSVPMWVLSAGLIEFAVGVALLIGYRTRLTTAIAFAVLSLSFFYFGEDVSSHITLFGVLSVLLVTRGGKLSFDYKMNHRNRAFEADIKK